MRMRWCGCWCWFKEAEEAKEEERGEEGMGG